MKNPRTHYKPDPRLKVVKVYLGDEEAATLQSHCHALDTTCSAFLRKVGLKMAKAHQQISRYPGRAEGPCAGRARALFFPGASGRRMNRGALRPMRT